MSGLFQCFFRIHCIFLQKISIAVIIIHCRIAVNLLPVVFGFVSDAAIRLIVFPRSWRVVRDLISFACIGAIVLLLWDENHRKPLVENTALVTNEALACLTSIIKEEEDNTWTIVSANDETQMGLYHGYH